MRLRPEEQTARNFLRRKYLAMKTLGIICGMTLALGLAVQSRADTVTFDFASPTGKLGTSQVYISDGETLTAYGFQIGKHNKTTPTDLYGKQSGPDESGLGINYDPGKDHEISPQTFVQLDISGLSSSTIGLEIGSVQAGEGFAVYGSNTLGGLGTWISSGGHKLDGVLFTNNYAGYQFLDITATRNNVVLGELTTSTSPTPEPATLGMLGGGLLLLGGMRLRKRRAAE